jgi:hypothetical protein
MQADLKKEAAFLRMFKLVALVIMTGLALVAVTGLIEAKTAILMIQVTMLGLFFVGLAAILRPDRPPLFMHPLVRAPRIVASIGLVLTVYAVGFYGSDMPGIFAASIMGPMFLLMTGLELLRVRHITKLGVPA